MKAYPNFQPDGPTWGNRQAVYMLPAILITSLSSTVLLYQVTTSSTPSHSRGLIDILTKSLPAILTSTSQFGALPKQPFPAAMSTLLPIVSTIYKPAYQIIRPLTKAVNVSTHDSQLMLHYATNHGQSCCCPTACVPAFTCYYCRVRVSAAKLPARSTSTTWSPVSAYQAAYLPAGALTASSSSSGLSHSTTKVRNVAVSRMKLG